MKKFISLLLIFLISCPVFGADVKWTAKTELTAIDDADVLLVVDDAAGTPISKKITVLNFFDTIDTSAKLLAIITDETGTGVSVFGTSPTFTTQLTITPVASPTTSTDGVVAVDIDGWGTNFDAWEIYNGTASAYFVATTASDTPSDGQVPKFNTGGSITWENDDDTGGATAWSAIGDPTNSGLTTITFDNAELSLLTGDNDAAAAFFTIQNTDADHTGGNFFLLDLDYSADDGDVDADFIRFQDSGGVVMTIQSDGDIDTDGGIDSAGVVVLGDGGDNFSVASDGIDIDTSGNITNAGTIASGVVTVTGVINTSVGIDAVGAVDFDIGSGDVLDVTIIEDGGTYIFNNGFTAVGEDLGSATAEWNDLFLNDGGVIQLGNDQDVTITHVADTGILINLEVEIDGTLDADGIVVLGDGGDNFSVASDGIDIDTSGNITNAGTIASGVITATGLVNTSVGLDAVGAVDLDYGSADVTDHTFVSDGGTAIIDGTVTAAGSFIIGAADLNEADMEKLDGITDGTAAANKAVVLDASLDIATINSLTATTLIGDGSSVTNVDAITGDAAVDFFGAGVDAVTDTTTCTDIEGDKLTITGSVLSVDTRTIRIPIMGAMTVPDTTGECYMAPISVEMALATGLMKNLVMVLKDPSADTGFYGTFLVPKDYVDTANIVVRGVLDGTVGATSLDFEMSYLARADNETIEAAWAESVAFNTGNTNGWTDEDELEDSAALTDGNFAVDDTVYFYFKRDQGTDDFAGDFHVTGLFFEYQDD